MSCSCGICTLQAVTFSVACQGHLVGKNMMYRFFFLKKNLTLHKKNLGLLGLSGASFLFEMRTVADFLEGGPHLLLPLSYCAYFFPRLL